MSLPSKSSRVFNGKKIQRFKSDGTRPSPVSPSDANELVDGLNALSTVEIVRGPSDTVIITPSKTVFQIAGNSSAGGSGKMSMRFKWMGDFYLVCRTWDGTTEGTVDILVAKPFKLRYVSVEILRGLTVSYNAYDYTLDGQTRIATGSGALPETQYITPPYLVDDLLQVDTGVTTLVNDPFTGLPLTLQDSNNDARAWASY